MTDRRPEPDAPDRWFDDLTASDEYTDPPDDPPCRLCGGSGDLVIPYELAVAVVPCRCN